VKVAKKTNPELWEKAKAQAKAKMGGKHSARAMQLAVSLYKKAGGGYSGAKKATSLSKWTKQNWRTKSGKPSSETGERYLPEKRSNPYLLKSTQPPLEPSVRGQQKVSNSLHNRRQSLRR
jgi:hypothetical protein